MATRGSGPTNAPGTHPAVPKRGPGRSPEENLLHFGLPRIRTSYTPPAFRERVGVAKVAQAAA